MSNDKEIGAVEWIIEKLTNRQNGVFDGFPHLSVDEIYDKAKEMQKKQHANTWDDSRVEDKGDNYIGKQKSFNDYYEETYGNNQ
jgi:hypothetical protein